MSEIEFLGFEDVLAIHRSQLEHFGGQDGFIDECGSLGGGAAPIGSAVCWRRRCYLAAAYLFHIAATQGFLDGNKRTGANAALQFLFINGYDLDATSDDLFEMTMKVANHAMQKNEIAEWFRARLISGDAYDGHDEPT